MKNYLLILFMFTSVLSYSQKLSKEERQAIIDAKKHSKEYAKFVRDSVNGLKNGEFGFKNASYCLIVGTQQFLSKKVTVTIDYGQRSTYFSREALRDNDGKRIIFNSMVDALNYLSNKGWRFVQAYVITIGKQNVYHYLMERESLEE